MGSHHTKPARGPNSTPTILATPQRNIKDGVLPQFNTRTSSIMSPPATNPAQPETTLKDKRSGGYYDVAYNWVSEREDMEKRLG
jgi:hypothetical protein